MMKFRITFNTNNNDEIAKAIEILKENFDVIEISNVYANNRNKFVSNYARIYADVELKKDEE